MAFTKPLYNFLSLQKSSIFLEIICESGRHKTVPKTSVTISGTETKLSNAYSMELLRSANIERMYLTAAFKLVDLKKIHPTRTTTNVYTCISTLPKKVFFSLLRPVILSITLKKPCQTPQKIKTIAAPCHNGHIRITGKIKIYLQ